MRKERTVRIISRLRTVVGHLCLCQYISVPVSDTAPHYIFGKGILSLVVRAVYKCSGSNNREIDNITHQSDKQDYKKVSDPCKFSILNALFAFCPSSVWGLLRISARFLPSYGSFGALFFPSHLLPSFLFPVFLPHPPEGYTVPV